MQKSGTPMESKKDAKPRTSTNQGVTINVNSNPTDDGSKRRLAKPKTEQPEDTKPNTETNEPEETRPPIYDTMQRLTGHSNGRTQSYASPLAASLFTRFDPNFTGVQPAEHYTYIDRELIRNGRL